MMEVLPQRRKTLKSLNLKNRAVFNHSFKFMYSSFSFSFFFFWKTLFTQLTDYYKSLKLTTVQLIWVICTVFSPITPPSFVDALSRSALKLSTATTSCREHIQRQIYEVKTSAISHLFMIMVWAWPSWFELKRSFTHLIQFIYCSSDKWVTVFMTAVPHSVCNFWTLKHVILQLKDGQFFTMNEQQITWPRSKWINDVWISTEKCALYNFSIHNCSVFYEM